MTIYCPTCGEETPTFGEGRCTWCYDFKGWHAVYLRIHGPSRNGG